MAKKDIEEYIENNLELIKSKLKADLKLPFDSWTYKADDAGAKVELKLQEQKVANALLNITDDKLPRLGMTDKYWQSIFKLEKKNIKESLTEQCDFEEFNMTMYPDFKVGIREVKDAVATENYISYGCEFLNDTWSFHELKRN